MTIVDWLFVALMTITLGPILVGCNVMMFIGLRSMWREMNRD